MTKDEKSKCQAIIHGASAAAAAIGGGLAQLPGSDTVPITAIQVGMIVSLGSVFGQDITKSVATSIISGFVASYGGRTVSQILVGWIPLWGNALNATTAFSITEALGWAAAKIFEKGESLDAGNEEGEEDGR